MQHAKLLIRLYHASAYVINVHAFMVQSQWATFGCATDEACRLQMLDLNPP